MNDDRRWMREALQEARNAAEQGEVPIGCVIVRHDEIIARAHNRREMDADPLAHAELLAIRQAARVVGGWRLLDCILYVTLEPCAMCAGACVNSRIERVVYGTADPKGGFCGSLGNLVQDRRLNHRMELTAGVLQAECKAQLKAFFAALRQRTSSSTKADKGSET